MESNGREYWRVSAMRASSSTGSGSGRPLVGLHHAVSRGSGTRRSYIVTSRWRHGMRATSSANTRSAPPSQRGT